MISAARSICLGALVAGLLTLPALAAPRLVKDLHTGPADESFYVYGRGAWNGIFYHGSGDPAHGVELWRSDGTPAGTERITDVCPGRCDSNPVVLGLFGGWIYFTADDGVSGRELWRTNGRPGAERRVRDLCPGPCNGDVSRMQELGGEILFLASDGVTESLWRTRGTRRSTVRAVDLCQVPVEQGVSSCVWGNFLPVGDVLLFPKLDPTGQRLDLWRTDGTQAGTTVVRDDLPPFSAGLSGVSEGIAFFWAGQALWKTDGTAAGTVRLKGWDELLVRPNDTSQYVLGTTFWNGDFYSLMNGGELIRSDGTPEGTVRVQIFQQPTGLLALDPGLLITAGLNSAQQVLWVTQGEPGTTRELADFSNEGYLGELVRLGEDQAAILVGLNPGEYDLWVTDGTPGGTRSIELEGVGSPYDLLPAGDLVYWITRANEFRTLGLWRSDGTPGGTFQVRELNGGPGSGGPLAQAVLRDRLVFSARTGAETAPLFVSDGTTAGTRVISTAAGWARTFVQAGDQLFFPTATMTRYPEWIDLLVQKGLWKTDGTAAGTRPVDPNRAGIGGPLWALGNKVLFPADLEVSPHGVRDIELFWADTVRQGAPLLKNIDPYRIDSSFHHICVGESSNPGEAVASGGRLFFAARDGVNGNELWVSDGTRQGTVLVRDINPRTVAGGSDDCELDDLPPRERTGVGSDPRGLAAFRNGVLFTAEDGTSGRELWWSDGTPGGTRRVADLRAGAGSSNPHDLVAFRGAVYFLASTPDAGEALWRTDGTEAGTVLVRNLTLRGLPSWGRSLTVVGGRLFFSLYNESNGAELWTSQGTAESTRIVKDIRPGAPGSYPQMLTNAGGVLVFAASDGQTGLEPWRSDGTAAGTRRLGDIFPGLDSSSPGPFSKVGTVVLTSAYEDEHGRELWAIPMADVR